jgi:hypothetical protein
VIAHRRGDGTDESGAATIAVAESPSARRSFTMTRKLLSWTIAAALAGATPAFAAAVTFVSVTGTDSGSCATPAAPCRTFQYAFSQTVRNGEIFALTPGDFGPVVIRRSISISGVEGAGIFGPPHVSQLIVVEWDADAVVNLTGLTFERSAAYANGPHLSGIVVNPGGGVVTVRNCVFRNAGFDALESAGSRLLIEDSSFSDSRFVNIRLGNVRSAAIGQNLVHRVVSQAAWKAIDSWNSRVTISDSVLANSEMGLENRSPNNSPIFMTRSMVTGNSSRGLEVPALSSGGDNFIRGNATDVVGAITNIGRQ